MFENPKGCSSRDVHERLTTRRAALGAADLERAAREAPPPPSRDVPRAGCVCKLLDGCVTRWYQELFGNSWDFLWDADDSSWGSWGELLTRGLLIFRRVLRRAACFVRGFLT